VRVLQLSKFYPPVMGGIEAVAWELTEGLHRAGVVCRVLCSNQSPQTVRERAPAGYEVLRVGSWGRVLSTSMAPTMPWHLRRLAPQHDAESAMRRVPQREQRLRSPGPIPEEDYAQSRRHARSAHSSSSSGATSRVSRRPTT